MAIDINPVEGFVALQLLEEDDDARKAQPGNGAPSPDSYNQAIYAIVVAVGPKAPVGIKKGSTVLARGYARDGLRVSDDVVLVETYCIAAVIG